MLYASGLSGGQIRKWFAKLAIGKNDQLKDIFRRRKEIYKWLQVANPQVKSGALFKADGFIEYLLDEIHDSVLGMFDMLIERNVAAKLARAAPTIYIRPGLSNIRVLDFNKHEEVFRQSVAAMEELRVKIQRVTAGWNKEAVVRLPRHNRPKQ